MVNEVRYAISEFVKYFHANITKYKEEGIDIDSDIVSSFDLFVGITTNIKMQ
ncbi:BMN1-like protein, partial (C-term) [Babesia microti strain RI]|uniref:BMN1-like protein, partial (C-term) n=1 Tax=Babesia microti (strain RI) TaxID=1133968 RepID=A0A1N6LX80_BABMR